jgi:hypothetical protein
MKLSPQIILIAIVLVVIGAAAAVRYRSRSRHPEFKTTDEMMGWLAAEAADIASKNGVKLDYSTQSIEQVEIVLGKMHEEYVNTKAARGADGLAMAFGAYIGEAIRRSDPDARWERDDPVGGEKSYPLRWRAGSSFVCAWCYRRITNGEEDNVWHKFLGVQRIAEQHAGAIGKTPAVSDSGP